MNPSTSLDILKNIAHQAGMAILKIYHDEDFSQVVDFKKDDSPLTLADQAAHKVIENELSAHFPDIPILSEEGAEIGYETRKKWDQFWLVDPLDGTKEFIKRNGEFTVNIALIVNHKPELGVIYVPVQNKMYWSDGNKSFMQEGHGPINELKVAHRKANRIAVRSKSHAAPEEEAILNKYGVTDSISAGSSLKFCMVAEGKADIYYRHGPTMEWDTGAGQAIVQGAGGTVHMGTGEGPFLYNKKSLLNGGFLCLSNIALEG